MTSAQRIALNVAATYGRSLYALVCGLFSGRWMLQAMGETDYGLYGVIGGLALFVSFFNELLAVAVERFFAYSVGEERARMQGDGGLQTAVLDCQRWFSVAAGLHAVLAVILTAVGYPVGAWAIRHYLNIPPERVEACIWVFRFVCCNCFVTMLSVPYGAMYRAKQLIAELTVYGLVQTTANVLVLGYAVTHPADWLVGYAAWWCALMVVPQLLIDVQALRKFPECRFSLAFALDCRRQFQLVDFMASRFVCMLAQLLSGQGLAVVVNKYLGAAKNAALTVSNSVSYHTMNLSGAMAGAFMPAITNAAGAGELDRMREYAYRTCLLSTLMVLVIAVPLSLEVDLTLRFWLATPPDGAAGLCLCVLATAVVERLSDGHWMSIFAIGDIRRFQLVESVAFFGAFALGWALVGGGFDVLGAGIGVLVGRSAGVLVKLWYGRKIAGLSVRTWLRRALLPVLLLSVSSLAVGVLPRFLMAESLVRIVVTAAASLGALLPLAWFFVLSGEDRKLVLSKLGVAR